MNDAEDEKPFIKLLVLVGTIVVASIGSNIGYDTINPPRSDPFTGSDGERMKAELERKIERLEERVRQHDREAEQWKLKIQSNKDRIDFHFRKHP
jgi:hypothetical protein